MGRGGPPVYNENECCFCQVLWLSEGVVSLVLRARGGVCPGHRDEPYTVAGPFAKHAEETVSTAPMSLFAQDVCTIVRV